MPITTSAKKANAQAKRRRVFNMRRTRVMKDVIKRIQKRISEKDAEGATALIPEAYKAIDKATKRGVIKQNTASRKKSRLAASIKKASQD